MTQDVQITPTSESVTVFPDPNQTAWLTKMECPNCWRHLLHVQQERWSCPICRFERPSNRLMIEYLATRLADIHAMHPEL